MQHLHNAQASIQSDEVCELQRTHGHTCTILHDRIYALFVTDSGLQCNDRFVDIRHEDPIGQEARRVSGYRRDLAHTFAELQRCRQSLWRRLQTGDDFHTLHHRDRVHEVCADHSATGGQVGRVRGRGSCNASDADGGSVGGEDGVGWADLGEAGEDLELEVEDLGNSLDDHVDVVKIIHVGRGRQSCTSGISVRLAELLLGDIFCQKLVYHHE